MESVSMLKMGREEVNQADVDKFHFQYIVPDEQTQADLDSARVNYRGMLSALHSIPNGRCRALAITHLEKSLMYCTKAIVVAGHEAQ
jgi:hypothetical protein